MNEPRLPETVLFGLIFVNFTPPIIFPTTYPPISEKIIINKINNTKEEEELRKSYEQSKLNKNH